MKCSILLPFSPDPVLASDSEEEEGEEEEEKEEEKEES
jgi:hypothetical protein